MTRKFTETKAFNMLKDGRCVFVQGSRIFASICVHSRFSSLGCGQRWLYVFRGSKFSLTMERTELQEKFCSIAFPSVPGEFPEMLVDTAESAIAQNQYDVVGPA